jgi:hypothetical protein
MWKLSMCKYREEEKCNESNQKKVAEIQWREEEES